MKKILGFVAGTATLAVVFTFLISLDIFIVKALVGSRERVGLYAAAATLAKAPFFLFLAIANVTLPSVSRALASQSPDLVRTYVAQSFRLHLMLLMPLTAIVSASASGVVSLIYKTGYSGASPALSILIVAFMFWGLLNGVFNLMLASRQTRVPVGVTLILIVLMVAIGRYMTLRWDITGAAVSAAVTGFIGLLAAGVLAYRQFGSLVSGYSLFRIFLASVIAFLCAGLINTHGMAVIIGIVGAFVAYTLVLYASGEITAQDISRLARVSRS